MPHIFGAKCLGAAYICVCMCPGAEILGPVPHMGWCNMSWCRNLGASAKHVFVQHAKVFVFRRCFIVDLNFESGAYIGVCAIVVKISSRPFDFEPMKNVHACVVPVQFMAKFSEP